MDDYNRKAFISNFPPENRWEKIEGVFSQHRLSVGDNLVSISGRDHKGDPAQLWVDLPNATYLLALLAQLQAKVNAPVPSEQPGKTKPHPSD